MNNCQTVAKLLSDQYMFFLLQGLLFLVLLLSIGMERLAQSRAGQGNMRMTVTRAEASMNMYYRRVGVRHEY